MTIKAQEQYPAPSQLSIIWGMTKYSLKASLKNRNSYFFSFIFPIVFVTVFGLFGSGSNPVEIGLPDGTDTTNPIYKVIEKLTTGESPQVKFITGSEADLEKKLSQDKISSILSTDVVSPVGLDSLASPSPSIATTVSPVANVIESSTSPEVMVPTTASTHLTTSSLTAATTPPVSIKLITSNGSPQGKAISESLLTGVISQMNLQAAHITKPSFIFTTTEISGKSYRPIDFALPGQIGFSMLSLATFGVAFTLITLRKTLVLKRMFATTVTPLTFVISQCLSRSVQAVLQTLLILAVGVWGFHFTLAHGGITVIEMVFVSFLGILAFLGFGILISNLAKDEQSLPIALNLFNLPQILLAGIFFPTDGMPQWIQLIGNNLPVAYLATALRKIAIEGLSIFQVWPYLVGMLAWAIVAYLLAAKTFKTE